MNTAGTSIGSAVRFINRNLDESGLFGDVSQNELRGISTTLRKLSPRQTHDAISQLPDADLDTWMDEVGSRGLFGTGGLSADDRSDLFSDLHASLGTGQIARIYHAAGDTGMQSELVRASSDATNVEDVAADMQQRLAAMPAGEQRDSLQSAATTLSQNQLAGNLARLSIDAYVDYKDSSPKALPPGIRRLDPEQLPAELGITGNMLVDEAGNPDFHAAIYQVGGENNAKYVVAFRGVDNWTDWLTVFASEAGKTAQFSAGQLIAEKLVAAKGGDKVMVTGHSLGGGIANHTAIVNGIRSITFNTKGTSYFELTETGDYSGSAARRLTTNYQVKGELLTGVQENTGMADGPSGRIIKVPAIKPDGNVGNLPREVVEEVLLASVPMMGGKLANNHDVSSPLERHGRAYLQRSMGALVNRAKDVAIAALYDSFKQSPVNQE